MATTSPDNIRTPDLGDPYNLVPDLQTLANDVQDALIERANSYTGTESQRNAFTSQAPDGALWIDTDGDKQMWRKDGNSWVAVIERITATRNFMSPFTPYSTGNVVTFLRYGDVVTIHGVAGLASSSTIGGTNNAEMFEIPEPFRPNGPRQVINQGSGVQRWYLYTATVGGTVYGRASRYSASDQSNIWLPFTWTYVI